MTDHSPTISERTAALGRRCRHYDPRGGIVSGQDCRLGHGIREAVYAAAGTIFGLAYMLPCQPGPEMKVSCPDYNPKTDGEIEADNAAMNAAIDAFVAALPAINAIRRTMIEGRVASRVFTCPWCHGDRFQATCAIAVNDHVRGACADCGKGFME